ncbi:MAG: hypothetical protein LBC73_02785 [Oscillospiraceae bacterium]|nr:hypothetical protein [Oscillospiraceae bacterium]
MNKAMEVVILNEQAVVYKRLLGRGYKRILEFGISISFFTNEKQKRCRRCLSTGVL